MATAPQLTDTSTEARQARMVEQARNTLASGTASPEDLAQANKLYYTLTAPKPPPEASQTPQVQFKQNPAFQNFTPNYADQQITGPLGGMTGQYQNNQFVTQETANKLANILGGQVSQTDFQRFGQAAPEYQINLGGQDRLNAGLISDAITKYGFDNPLTQALLRQGTPGNMPFQLPGQQRQIGTGTGDPNKPPPPPVGTKFGGPGDTAGGPPPPPPGATWAGARQPFGGFNPLGGFYGYPYGGGFSSPQVNQDPYGYNAGMQQNVFSPAAAMARINQFNPASFGTSPQFGNMDFGGGLSSLQSGLFGGGGLPFGRGFYGYPQQNFGNYGGFGFGGFNNPLSSGFGGMSDIIQLLNSVQGLRQRLPQLNTGAFSGRSNFYPGFY